MLNQHSGLVMTDLDTGRVNPVVGLHGHCDNDRRHTHTFITQLLVECVLTVTT